jgi:hypothetical protein
VRDDGVASCSGADDETELALRHYIGAINSRTLRTAPSCEAGKRSDTDSVQPFRHLLSRVLSLREKLAAVHGRQAGRYRAYGILDVLSDTSYSY